MGKETGTGMRSLSVPDCYWDKELVGVEENWDEVLQDKIQYRDSQEGEHGQKRSQLRGTATKGSVSHRSHSFSEPGTEPQFPEFYYSPNISKYFLNSLAKCASHSPIVAGPHK